MLEENSINTKKPSDGFIQKVASWMLKPKLKSLLIFTNIVYITFIVYMLIVTLEAKLDYKRLDETLTTVTSSVAKDACYSNNTLNEIKTGKNHAVLINKREKVANCPDGEGNVLYARCYNISFNKNADLILTPTRDVPIKFDSYSCIDEDLVRLPQISLDLKNAELGKSFILERPDS